ncbi:MAG: tetratricopeptide repeat protein [Clostridia bacterium]
MEFNDILKDLKKVDLERIKQSDVQIFKNEKIAVEYYNDAVGNILEGNVDIAAIKLKKVMALSPDFEEASRLYARINEYEYSKSIGDKVYENIRGRDTVTKSRLSTGKTLPQRLNVKPRVLLKVIMVLLTIAITVLLSIIIFKLAEKPEDENKPSAATYSQEEVNILNERIDQLEANLAASEAETQTAMGDSAGDKERITQLEAENDRLEGLLNLYKAAAYFENGQYVQSADIVRGLDAVDYIGGDRTLYDEVYRNAMGMAADSIYTIGLNLYNQQEYQGAIDNLVKVEQYNPDFGELGRCYYIMGISYFELGNAAKAIELYEHIQRNIPSFTNTTGLLYYTGKAYQKLGDFEKARELYNLLISGYPNSSLVGNARDRLREME